MIYLGVKCETEYEKKNPIIKLPQILHEEQYHIIPEK